MGTQRAHARRKPSPELMMLSEINQRLVRIEANLDEVKAEAVKQGALSGAVAGGISGGLVATAIFLIKAKLGLV